MKALFLWRDGQSEYGEVVVPLLPVYHRVIRKPLGSPSTVEAAKPFKAIRTASFRLVRFRDGSFQYNEVAG
jgi:hypothetical protein